MGAYMNRAETVEWATPPGIFEQLNARWGFTLDPCATPENATCPRYYTAEDDGLAQSWAGERVYCNPPYGRTLPAWIEKAHRESLRGAVVVMLIPARTDTAAWHRFIFPHAAEIVFLRGRLKFGGTNEGAPFPSVVVRFGGEYSGIRAAEQDSIY